ncbi:hypothetical protein MMC21_004460 [Puttea exsequens]|nr:hypothetical protein [Puttea exsequens]
MAEQGGLLPTSRSPATPPATSDGNHLLSQFSSNPFFTGGLGLAAFAAVVAAGQRGVRRGASLLKQRLLVDLEINVKDDTFDSFLHWVIKHQQDQLSVRGKVSGSGVLQSVINRFSPRMHHLSIETKRIELPNGSVRTGYLLVPGPGRHILRYKNAFLMVNRMRESRSLDRTTGKPWETVTLTTLYSKRHIFEDIFLEAHNLAQQSTEGKTIVYTPRTADWGQFGEPRRKRPLESVVLDKGVKESIVSDLKDFLNNGRWYYDRGIPYRRGYLLHGPPGTGKSSLIQAVAGELDYSIAMLNLSQLGLTDDRLNHLLSVIPKRTLVVLEDADAAFANRRTATDEHGFQGTKVTFSGLLNAIDGVGSAEERVLFLTTNHPKRLDAALVRPGRIDMAVRLGEVTRWQAGQLWDRFYGNWDEEGEFKLQFLRRIDELGAFVQEADANERNRRSTSAAAIQGLFLYNKDNMEGAIAMASHLFPEEPSAKDKTVGEGSGHQVSRA